jgi:hypothetical protein
MVLEELVHVFLLFKDGRERKIRTCFIRLSVEGSTIELARDKTRRREPPNGSYGDNLIRINPLISRPSLRYVKDIE